MVDPFVPLNSFADIYTAGMTEQAYPFTAYAVTKSVYVVALKTVVALNVSLMAHPAAKAYA